MSDRSPTALRALLVDDEPLARDRLRSLLEQEPGIEIAGECASGAEALALIRREAPDVVFLDVEMPGMDGFEVLRRLQPGPFPAIVFVTAFDEYAVRAFDVHAVDYLLKPFDAGRLGEALARVRAARARVVAPAEATGIDALLATLAERPQPATRIPVRARGRVFFVHVADIDWVEADANYVRLHARGEVHQVRESMQNMERRLPAQMFLRIHRSSIINIERVREFQPWFHGEYIAILQDGTKLTVSRAYSHRLHDLIH